jgi:hypothetical protein
MWGRLATCAAVGYRRRSTAKAAGADCQSAAGYQPAPQNLVRQPTPAQFFMGFRGPKAHPNSIRKSRIHAEAALALKPFAGKFATLVRHRTWYRVAALATTTKNAITSATAQP